MPENFEQRLANVTKKAELLTQRYSLLLQQRDLAYSQIEELKRQLDDNRKTIEQLSAQVQHLQMAAIVETDAGDIENARALLSELVWEIDKCIAQLND